MSFFYKLIAVILAAFVYFPFGSIAAYSPANEGAELVFSVVSDVHMESNNSEKFNLFGEGIRDINAATRNDAVVFLGDNTMNGQMLEYAAFYGLFDRLCNTDNLIVASGNHDLCSSNMDPQKFISQTNQFINFYNTFADEDIETPYYSREINGYKFIVLASELDLGVQEYLSAEQLAWFANELEAAEESGKPVFVFNHYPLSHTWPLVWPLGHVGVESEALHLLMRRSENQIVYFSGHLHMGLNNNKVSSIKEGNITYVNVPAFGADNNITDADIQNQGMGMYVEVYEDEILIRVRNYADHEWMEIEHSISL